MPKKTIVPSEVLRLAMETAQRAKTADELRAAQSVILPGLLGLGDRTTAELLGRSRATVVRMRKEFRQQHTGQKAAARNWGGRRHHYIPLDQERQFLSAFFDRAKEGGVISAVEIKRAFEVLVGREVAKTTIYRMLDRHGWRKITPRPRHPNSDPKARKGFKKTAHSGDPVR